LNKFMLLALSFLVLAVIVFNQVPSNTTEIQLRERIIELEKELYELRVIKLSNRSKLS